MFKENYEMGWNGTGLVNFLLTRHRLGSSANRDRLGGVRSDPPPTISETKSDTEKMKRRWNRLTVFYSETEFRVYQLTYDVTGGQNRSKFDQG